MVNYPQPKEVRQLFIQGQPVTYGKGEVILGNSTVPDGIYYLESGYVKAYSISDDGDEYLHLVYAHGELFPLIWAYLGVLTESLFYEAMTDCTLWRISKSSFERFAKTDVIISYALSTQLAQQFRIFSDRIDNLEYKNASQRVAYRLLFLASRFGVRHNGTIVIEAPITHEIFAHSINLARESVSRELEKLVKLKILKSHNHQLEIRNVQALLNTLSRPVGYKSWHL
jgi:CRP-like cAMP-binding protein